MDQDPLPPPSPAARRWPVRLDAAAVVALASVALWLVLVWPLAAGRETLFFRDVFHTHHPLKAFGAAALHEGEIPATNPTWGLGQPFRGNPNALAFYPGNLLYLLLPFWPAFNLHYALHWLLAGVAMGILARILGQGRPAAVLAGLAYAGSGWMFAALTFYNIVVVAAWWPLVLAGGARGGRRGIALGALGCGLALLGGEPVTALLGVPLLVAIAVARQGWVRGLAASLGIGAGGLVVASPQIVAALRILPTTVRGGEGLLASQASYYSFEPMRVVELLLPFPFGMPGVFGPTSIDAVGVLSHLPYFFCLHFGVLAFVLALIASPARRMLAAFAGAGVILAWLGGASGELLLSISAGVFRTPEKLLFWTALTLPLLAGWGLERLLRDGGTVRSAPERRSVGARGATLLWIVAVLSVAAAILLIVLGASGDEGQTAPLDALRRLAGVTIPPTLATARSWSNIQIRSLLAAGILLGLAGLAVRTRRAQLLLVLQLVSVVQMRPLLLTDTVSAYEDLAAWGGAVHPGNAVIHVRGTYPPWRVTAPGPVYDGGSYALDSRAEARELAAAPGVLHGLRYPAAPDLDGMVHRFYLLTLFRLSQGSWPERVAWSRVLGVDLVVSPEAVTSRGVVMIGSESRPGSEVRLYRILDPSPRVWWPRSTRAAATPSAAFSLVASTADALDLAVLPQPVPQDPAGTARVLAWENDRIELESETAGGGVVVVRRAFSSLWRAQDARGVELPVLPADLTLLGVVVPPGKVEVALAVDSGPETLAGVLAILAFLTLAATAVVRPRSRS